MIEFMQAETISFLVSCNKVSGCLKLLASDCWKENRTEAE